jgi:adenine-specific DNA methylase
MTDKPRLIERAFPLKQASLNSVHEKNVRHGHISTLHIWPARRPLAACRAALIATLLPDPGTPEERRKLCERIGGKVIEKIEKKKMPNGKIVERIKEETKGGILHWLGSKPSSGGKKKLEEYEDKAKLYDEELEWFRQEIRKAYGGRAPRVLDPFAGGGAIPLEAMRLGCEATAVDINPVAWFVQKCTLEYPQKLAGKTHKLPDFILEDEDFMEAFYKAHPHLAGRTKRTKKQTKEFHADLFMKDNQDSGRIPKADLAWHVRAWGQWVLNHARVELSKFYPTYADFEPLPRTRQDLRSPLAYEKQEMRFVPLNDDGTPDIGALNDEFSKEYLSDKRNPRWVAKPTVAYLWARTVKCKNCRATLPLLKTRWLCKKTGKRVLLTMEPAPDKTGVVFGIKNNVPVQGGNTAQKREHDKKLGAGTMSRSGAKCPCCPAIMTMADIRVEGKAGNLGSMMTAVVVNTRKGKEYRLPTEHEINVATLSESQIEDAFKNVPFGVPDEPTPAGGGNGAGRAFSVQGYGLMKWRDMFMPRQLLSLGVLVKCIRNIPEISWRVEVRAFLSCVFGKLLDYENCATSWYAQNEQISHFFKRFALPILWDFAEASPVGGASGSWKSMLNSVCKSIDNSISLPTSMVAPSILNQSSISLDAPELDLVITDPPYYDAIPYSDLTDFFYIWHRRMLCGLSSIFDKAFANPLSPKWNHDENDGELIDDSSRHGFDAAVSKQVYEDGMARVFSACWKALAQNGRIVIVFANKQPDAWETLVAAAIRAGFVVIGSWPIQTEMTNRARSHSSAALASSVWLVCKKRPVSARAGWDNRVLDDMRKNISERLRDFWDAGIRGPDFVWAATGPALEAYSKHPIVKKANAPGEIMPVGEFLTHVRRMVVDFVVGQVLTGDEADGSATAADRMDAPTAYYLLHRNDFGVDEAPAGACILYATACGMTDRELDATWSLISHKGGKSTPEDDDTESDPDADGDPDDNGNSGSKIKLKTWAQRKNRSMGFEAPSGKPIPLIDRVHRLMHLWKSGDVHKVDEYLDDNGLRRQELFKRLVQSLIELSRKAGESEELKILESLSNHVQAKGATKQDGQGTIAFGKDES